MLRRTQPPAPTDEEIWTALAPNGKTFDTHTLDLIIDLYKMMVTSSENLVGRRQGVNTFFLTANGALLTGIGLVVQNGGDKRLTAVAVFVLSLTGALIAYAWKSLLISFGQLNSGKFAVINRLESLLPVSIYSGEWKALADGKNPRIYRSFTAREIWPAMGAFAVYVVSALISVPVIFHWYHP